jgi:hypothetical protein
VCTASRQKMRGRASISVPPRPDANPHVSSGSGERGVEPTQDLHAEHPIYDLGWITLAGDIPQQTLSKTPPPNKAFGEV